jgi:hypothetical protein
MVVPDDFNKTHQYEQGNAYQITNQCSSVQEAKSSVMPRKGHGDIWDMVVQFGYAPKQRRGEERWPFEPSPTLRAKSKLDLDIYHPLGTDETSASDKLTYQHIMSNK